MRPAFKRSVTLALCGVLASSGLAFAATPDRAAALERLRKSLPSISETLPIGRMAAMATQEQLLQLNPGKAAQIKPIADRFGACLTEVVDGARLNDAAVAAVDKSDFTEADLLKVAAFYESPETKAMFSFLAKVLSGEVPVETLNNPPPELTRHIEVYQSDPTLVRFQQALKQSAQGAMAGAALQQGTAACGAEMGSATTTAGLKSE